MTHTGSINSKSGEIPQSIIWIYIILLKHHGYVENWSERIEEVACAPGYKCVKEYTIQASNGMTETFYFDSIVGEITATLSMIRNYTPIYEIGSSEPVKYIVGGT